MLARTIFVSFIFFFNDTATTEIYTLSLHDALPISPLLRPTPERGRDRHRPRPDVVLLHDGRGALEGDRRVAGRRDERSEEHTSELQSRQYLVCRLLLEKKK